MATFIKGLTDQFGPMQLYRPDYQFLTQVYGTRQAEYDRGFNMVRNLYNSVLNSAVTNGDNQTFRQEAFKKLQGALKSVSNVDLSNQTNIMRAQGLIDPISQDQDLAYDMAVTRFHQAQKQKMEQYKNSTDPKMRAMYNDFSKMDIAFAEEDLRNAKRGDGSLQKVQPREFVPFEDTMEYLRKAAKEQGLEITQSGPDGQGYIIKRVNGAGVAPIFSEWAKATMGNRFDRQFQVMGRVAAESSIRNEMADSKISREEAIQKISQKLLPTLNEKASTKGIEADSQLKTLDSEIELYEKKYPNGFPPSEPQIKENYQKLLEQREQRKTTLDNSRSEVAQMQQEGPQYVASNLYSVFTNEARERTAQSFGNSFATAKQSIEYRPDTTWATKARIASSERIASANLQFKYQDLAFRKEKFAVDTELKTIALKGKGYLPSETYLGSGVGEAQSGAELVSKGMQENRQKAQLAAFNAENGLALLVLNEDSKKFGELQGAVSKLQAFANGSGKQLTGAEWNVLSNYAKTLGINAAVPSKMNATRFLDQLAGGTYNAATKKLGEYSRLHKTGDSKKFVQAFSDASNAFKTLTSERENLNQNMLRLSQEVVDENGNIKAAYKGAKIRGRLATGGYDIDYSGVSAAAKERLNSLVTSEYSSRTRPVGSRYEFSKLNAAEIEVLIKDPYSVKSITASDGSTIDMSTLKNLTSSELAELFGDKANVFFDGKSAKVQLNLSQKTEITKKLGIKGTGTLTFDLPYESINANSSALGRFANYTQRNTVSSQSLGVLDDFLDNPNARVLGQDSHLGYGFDYSVTGTKDKQGRPALLFTMDFYNPKTKKNETLTEIRSFSPGNVNSLIDANEYINGIFDNYIQSRVGYELNQK
jgi:hypothetical protein